MLNGNGGAAHELVQAAIVKAYAAWPRIRRGEALGYARRVLINQRTDTWRATRHEVVTPQTPEPRTSSRSLAVPSATAVDDRDQVVRMLATLPEQQRKVIVLPYSTGSGTVQAQSALG